MQTDKKDLYYDMVGQYIQAFILRKWKSQKKAAAMLGVDAARLSNYISGDRLPSSQIILALAKYGFDPFPFEKWLGIEELEPDILTKKEILKLVAEQRNLIAEQSRLIRFLSDRLGS